MSEDDYSGLPFEEGRFGGEAAERAQVQIARVATPGITMKYGDGNMMILNIQHKIARVTTPGGGLKWIKVLIEDG